MVKKTEEQKDYALNVGAKVSFPNNQRFVISKIDDENVYIKKDTGKKENDHNQQGSQNFQEKSYTISSFNYLISHRIAILH